MLKEDIDIAHRVPSASHAKNLIARFTSRDKKADLISKTRKARLQDHDTGFHVGESRPIMSPSTTVVKCRKHLASPSNPWPTTGLLKSMRKKENLHPKYKTRPFN